MHEIIFLPPALCYQICSIEFQLTTNHVKSKPQTGCGFMRSLHSFQTNVTLFHRHLFMTSKHRTPWTARNNEAILRCCASRMVGSKIAYRDYRTNKNVSFVWRVGFPVYIRMIKKNIYIYIYTNLPMTYMLWLIYKLAECMYIITYTQYIYILIT